MNFYRGYASNVEQFRHSLIFKLNYQQAAGLSQGCGTAGTEKIFCAKPVLRSNDSQLLLVVSTAHQTRLRFLERALPAFPVFCFCRYNARTWSSSAYILGLTY
jgi:hypothetical protein